MMTFVLEIYMSLQEKKQLKLLDIPLLHLYTVHAIELHYLH